MSSCLGILLILKGESLAENESNPNASFNDLTPSPFRAPFHAPFRDLIPMLYFAT